MPWVKPAKTGHGLHCYKLVAICVDLLLFVLFYVLFVCKCVLYYCHRVSTQLQLKNMSYHIVIVWKRNEPFPYLLPFFSLLIGFPLLFPDEKLYGTTATGKLSAENQSDRRRNFTSANLSTTNLATINLWLNPALCNVKPQSWHGMSYVRFKPT